MERGSAMSLGELALEHLPSMAIIVDRAGRVVTTNHTWRQYFASIGVDEAHYLEGSDYRTLCRGAVAFGVVGWIQVIDAIDAICAGDTIRQEVEFATALKGHIDAFHVSMVALPDGEHVVISTRFASAADWAISDTGQLVLLDPIGGPEAEEQWELELADALRMLPPAGTVAVVAVNLVDFATVAHQLGPAAAHEAMRAYARRLQLLGGAGALVRRGGPASLELAIIHASDTDRLAEVIGDAMSVDLVIGTVVLSVPAAVGVAVNAEGFVLPVNIVHQARTLASDEEHRLHDASSTIRSLADAALG